MGETLTVDAIVNPTAARVVISQALGEQHPEPAAGRGGSRPSVDHLGSTNAASASPRVHSGDNASGTSLSPGLTARFDLSGLPRIESALLGRPVDTVPELTKRLCGICPVAHHLAGVRALETLLGYSELPPSAVAIRTLLALGSELDQLAPRLVFTVPPLARALRLAGKAAMAAAGAPGHFPDVAVPGGVRALSTSELIDGARAALADAQQLFVQAVDPAPGQPRFFPGAGDGTAGLFRLALVDSDGSLNLLGSHVAVFADGNPNLLDSHVAVLADGSPNPLDSHVAVLADGDGASLADTGCPADEPPQAIDMWPVERWRHHIRETNPGSATPRPEVLVDGAWAGYRVGPRESEVLARVAGVAAQLSRLLENPALTSGAIQAPAPQQTLREGADAAEPGTPSSEGPGISAGVTSAQGVVPPGGSCRTGDPTSNGAFATSVPAGNTDGSRYGIGVIDGPRGLLVHEYWANADGVLTDCRILTPTAQNELWLAQMLTAVITTAHAQGEPRQPDRRHADHGNLAALAEQLTNNPTILMACEDAIRAADPCLPCTMAPRGAMGLAIVAKA